jgi:hypothetical protein
LLLFSGTAGMVLHPEITAKSGKSKRVGDETFT